MSSQQFILSFINYLTNPLLTHPLINVPKLTSRQGLSQRHVSQPFLSLKKPETGQELPHLNALHATKGTWILINYLVLLIIIAIFILLFGFYLTFSAESGTTSFSLSNDLSPFVRVFSAVYYRYIRYYLHFGFLIQFFKLNTWFKMKIN